jgi:hypothetical protein
MAGATGLARRGGNGGDHTQGCAAGPQPPAPSSHAVAHPTGTAAKAASSEAATAACSGSEGDDAQGWRKGGGEQGAVLCGVGQGYNIAGGSGNGSGVSGREGGSAQETPMLARAGLW